MNLKEYISTVNQKYRAGNATEHSYRGALEQLMQTLLPKLRIVNEPKRVKCGAPDYIASRKDGMPVFYIEAKDIGDNDLDGRNHQVFSILQNGDIGDIIIKCFFSPMKE